MTRRGLVDGVVLGAGSARRMSLPKQLTRVGGKRLLEWVLDAAVQSSLSHVWLVLGSWEMRIRRELGLRLSHWKITVVSNPAFEAGMGTSLSVGFRRLAEESVGGAMVLLGDQPRITPELIDRLLERFHASDKPVCAAFHRGARGHPVVFSRTFFPALAALKGDERPRNLLNAHPNEVERVDVEPRFGVDVDTPEDLERVRASEMAGAPHGYPAYTPLTHALGVAPRERAAMVGAGGKTTLMFALARELADAGHAVVTTTSTRIALPSEEDTPCLVLLDGRTVSAVSPRSLLMRHGRITVGSRITVESKVAGLSLNTLSELFREVPDACVLVEADGAARKPLKVPRSFEPVMPPECTLVVGLMGMDALNQPLSEKWVFGSESLSRITGRSMGALLIPEVLARLALHPEGLFQKTPALARCIPFLNKVDVSAAPAACAVLARRLAAARRFPRVVYGSVKQMRFRTAP